MDLLSFNQVPLHDGGDVHVYYSTYYYIKILDALLGLSS